MADKAPKKAKKFILNAITASQPASQPASQLYTKLTRKRQEIFFNQTLAFDEIDRLFDAKAFSKFSRYTADGKQAVGEIKRHFDGTPAENLIIKGNNLIALHSLAKQFKGKVKLIYIDPPYNTGNDGFKYNDKFNHSTWLTFMKNRLEIAKTLLADDGSIWISLNDDEVHYAKVLCDEILGRDNFIANIIWHSKYTTSNDAKFISYQHENILFYAKDKSKFKIGGFSRTEKHNSSYKNPDNDPKGAWKATPLHAKSGDEKNNYVIEFPNGRNWTPPKGRFPRYSKQKLMEIYKDGGLYFNKNGGIDKKTYLSEVKQHITAGSVWNYEDAGHTHGNNEELSELIGKGEFENPKGTKLISLICQIANVGTNDIVLDYHAGSGTTAHTIFNLNQKDAGNRQVILIEQMDYIHNITVKRLQTVLKKNNLTQDFVYAELAPFNETAKQQILACESLDEIKTLFNELCERYFLKYNVSVDEFSQMINEPEFQSLPLDEQKQMVLEMLDLNQMYVSLSEMDDEQFAGCLNDDDKTLSRAFYQPVKNQAEKKDGE
ncbi:putative methyltransferase [Haemophilus influenzae]|uniref:site-specific DNA-methyltransferase n=1 Tax=Haemophilus influenzae TaxID=727 RepID=UPI000D021FEC|nr:site-specific DNA-methyltransferase [Haemophilus influenzae]PRM28213.1 putative methyltransferase [Haemophilus influenzae]